MIKSLLSLILLFISTLSMSVGANYVVDVEHSNRSYDVVNLASSAGFRQNNVLDITQDECGFMWFATHNGVYKYDGYDFDVFKSSIDGEKSIDHNYVVSVVDGPGKNVTILNKHEINVYDSEQGAITKIEKPKGAIYVYKNILYEREDPRYLWVISSRRVLILRLTESMLGVDSVFSPIFSFDDNTNILDVYQDKNGLIWLYSTERLICCHREGERIKEVFALPRKRIRSIVEDGEGRIYTCSASGVDLITPDLEKFKFKVEHYTFRQDGASLLFDDIFECQDGSILALNWVRGLYNLDLDGRRAIFTPFSANRRTLPSNDYLCGRIDRNKNLWIGTVRKGLYRVNLAQKHFSQIRRNAQLGYYVNQITGDDKGNIWCGTHGGGIDHIKFTGDKYTINTIASKIGLLERANVYAVNYLNGYLWYVGKDYLLSRAKVLPDGRLVQPQTIHKLHSKSTFFESDAKGGLYCAGYPRGGILYCADPTAPKPTFKPLVDEHGVNPFFSIGISALHIDSDGFIWAGTRQNGVYRVRLVDGVIDSVSEVEIVPQVRQSSILSFCEDDDRNVYVATFGSGMVVVSLDTIDDYSTYRYIQQQTDGLADNVVYSLHKDQNGDVWASTDSGLSCYNVKTKMFRNYNYDDGVDAVRVGYISEDGRLLFAGNRDVIYFHPDDIVDNKISPTIQITAFDVCGEPATDFGQYTFETASDDEECSEQPICELGANQDNITFKFASLHYSNPRKSQYQYMLKGVDNRWIDASSDGRMVTYSYLDYGDYTFYVRGTNSDGVWSDNYAAMRIRVLPHWWQTFVAKIFMLLIFALLSYVAYRQYVQRHRDVMNSKISMAKLNFFTNISHEIKTPLTIISGLLESKGGSGEDVALSSRDVAIIKRNNNRMLQLMTQLLDFRKMTEEHTPLKLIMVDIVNYVEELSHSFEHYGEAVGIKFKADIPETKIDMVIDPDKLEKVVSNLLSNAFKYTERGGDITLILKEGIPAKVDADVAAKIGNRGDEYITIAVKDTGDGMSKEDAENIFKRFYQVRDKVIVSDKKSGVGIGLTYSKTLVNLHKGYIYVESEVGVGSTFYVLLPRTLVQSAEVSSEERDVVLTMIRDRSRQNFLLDDNSITEPAETSKAVGDKEILVVDDNEDIRTFLAEILSPEYKVYTAADGVEGLEIATRTLPDLVISDVIMPNMDGLELCKRLKGDEKTNHIPVILLTANSTINDRVEGLKRGADSYIAKPFSVEHIKVRIEKLLEIRLLLKMKYQTLSSEDKPLVEIDINDWDKEFLQRVDGFIEENLDNAEIAVEDIEAFMGYSRMQLYRRMKSVTGITVVEYIRNYRLRRSVDMMRDTDMRINQILYAVGFSTPSYYSKCFKQRYGKTPADYLLTIRG